MRIPVSWLRAYCDPKLGLEELAERLTMTGTKVEAVEPPLAEGFSRFAVGRVERVEPHPNAQRLQVCEVALGKRTAQIVCGAPNVAAGQLVAVALPGALLPDGRRLEEATLRGVRSEGMILSAPELGLGGDGEGILVLDETAFLQEDGGHQRVEAGHSLATLLGGEGVLELEVTPNRPDCLSLYGVAREVHAATGAPLRPEPWQQDRGRLGPLEAVSVTVECPDLCPRFMARLFTGVQVRPSPLWLQVRLLEAGLRPINNVVDITNYVMLLCGQPLHAFDFERIVGRELTVRRSRAGEVVETLDGQKRSLNEEVVVIADQAGPTSIAGIMGGARSEVGAGTTTVLLEAATWDGPNIHSSSFRLGIRSEAASRFEKGLPVESARWGLALATNLLIALAGAEQQGGTVDASAAPEPQPPQIRLRPSRVGRVLGVEVPKERQVELLQALGFAPREEGGELLCSVPPWRRGDVTREADLIEELARLDALERLPATLPANRHGGAALTAAQRLRRRLADLLVDRGFYEVFGWTFASQEQLAELGFEEGQAVALRNPLSAEQRYLRPTLLVSLRAACAYNVDRDQDEPQLFELGRVFSREGAGVAEGERIAGLACGRLTRPGWRKGGERRWDFFAIKGVVEELLGLAGVEAGFRSAKRLSFLHPGRAAEAIGSGGEPLGWLGELHPRLVPDGLDRVAAFELSLPALLGRADRRPVFTPLPAFPALRRDLSLLVPRAVEAAGVVAALRKAGGRLLEEVRVIDLYEDPALGEAFRSLTFALTFRAADHTLKEREIDPLVAKIVAAAGELGCKLRGGGDG